jgi:hypothetical protein
MAVSPRTVPEKVALFLHDHLGCDYCDDCLGEHLSLARRQQAQQAISALATASGFNRGERTCSNCGRLKRVVRAS